MINANLNEIKKLLETKNYACEILNKSAEIPCDQLVIALELDKKQRSRLLLIRSIKQNLSAADSLTNIKTKHKSYKELQFILTLPFLVDTRQIGEIARLILLLNKGMELPGFELSEVDHLIYFRHSFLVPEDQLDERILLTLTGMIEMIVDVFSDILESVATDAKTLREVVEEAQRVLASQPPSEKTFKS